MFPCSNLNFLSFGCSRLSNKQDEVNERGSAIFHLVNEKMRAGGAKFQKTLSEAARLLDSGEY